MLVAHAQERRVAEGGRRVELLVEPREVVAHGVDGARWRARRVASARHQRPRSCSLQTLLLERGDPVAQLLDGGLRLDGRLDEQPVEYSPAVVV